MIQRLSHQPNPRFLSETIKPLGQQSTIADALKRCGHAEGYAILLGADDQQLVLSLAEASPWSELVIVESDTSRVTQLRTALNAAGIYGQVTVRKSAIEGLQSAAALCCSPDLRDTIHHFRAHQDPEAA